MPENPSALEIAVISARYGELERISQRRVIASNADMERRTAPGSHDRQSSRSPRAFSPASIAWRTGPPSRTSRTGMSASFTVVICFSSARNRNERPAHWLSAGVVFRSISHETFRKENHDSRDPWFRAIGAGGSARSAQGGWRDGRHRLPGKRSDQRLGQEGLGPPCSG